MERKGERARHKESVVALSRAAVFCRRARAAQLCIGRPRLQSASGAHKATSRPVAAHKRASKWPGQSAPSRQSIIGRPAGWPTCGPGAALQSFGRPAGRLATKGDTERRTGGRCGRASAGVRALGAILRTLNALRRPICISLRPASCQSAASGQESGLERALRVSSALGKRESKRTSDACAE